MTHAYIFVNELYKKRMSPDMGVYNTTDNHLPRVPRQNIPKQLINRDIIYTFQTTLAPKKNH